MPSSLCVAFVLLACPVGHAHRGDDILHKKQDSLQGEAAVVASGPCDEADRSRWTEVGATPPQRNYKIGDYDIVECLGSGAFGQVWTARESSESSGGEISVVIK